MVEFILKISLEVISVTIGIIKINSEGNWLGGS